MPQERRPRLRPPLSRGTLVCSLAGWLARSFVRWPLLMVLPQQQGLQPLRPAGRPVGRWYGQQS